MQNVTNRRNIAMGAAGSTILLLIVAVFLVALTILNYAASSNSGRSWSGNHNAAGVVACRVQPFIWCAISSSATA